MKPKRCAWPHPHEHTGVCQEEAAPRTLNRLSLLDYCVAHTSEVEAVRNELLASNYGKVGKLNAEERHRLFKLLSGASA